MLAKIIAFIMAVVTFMCNIFGVNPPAVKEENYRYYHDISYGCHERQTLDLYLPENTDGEAGLILFIHGGAWIAGDKDGYRDQLRYYAEEYGCAAAAINYRYLSYDVSFDDMLDDIENSVYKIKSLSKDNGIEISKMIATGGSAGGHLAMLYAYSRQDTSPVKTVAVLNYCGPTDLLDPNFHNENATDTLRELYRQIASLVYGEELSLEDAHLANDLLKKASPLYYVDSNTVPTVINHGMVDETVPYSNALSLEAKFIECGVTHIMNPYPNSGHGLDSDPESAAKADEYFKQYVEAYLK